MDTFVDQKAGGKLTSGMIVPVNAALPQWLVISNVVTLQLSGVLLLSLAITPRRFVVFEKHLYLFSVYLF